MTHDLINTVVGAVDDASREAFDDLRKSIVEVLDAALQVEDDLYRLSPSDSDDEKMGNHGREIVAELKADILGCLD